MRLPQSVFSMLCVLVLLPGALCAQEVVETTAGPVRGKSRDGVRQYLGIPYAAPPVGALRFKPPAPPQPWTEVRRCEQFGPACPQPLAGYGPIEPQDEAGCLTVNVWTAGKPGAKRPVLFWIHGGGFFIGASSQPLYDGAPLAKDGLTVVTFNYRLGPLGFLAHPALSAESPAKISGNYGLMDIVFALQWTKANIGRFGGDPDNITIMGESAGGAAVCALMVAPQSKGLFQRAVSMSGSQGAHLRELKSAQGGLNSMEAYGAELAQRLQIKEGADAAAALRAATPEALWKAVKFTSVIPGALTADHLNVDGVWLPGQIYALMDQGKAANVPFMTGTVADEGTIFSAKLNAKDKAGADAFLLAHFGAHGEAAKKLYASHDDASAKRALDDFCSDIFFRYARNGARAMARLQPDTYCYHFTRLAPKDAGSKHGVAHGYELRYFFGTTGVKHFGRELDGSGERALSKEIRGYLARFCATGNPNGGGALHWPRYTLAQPPGSNPPQKDDEQYLRMDVPLNVYRYFNHQRLDTLETLLKK